MAGQYKTRCPHCGAQFKISDEHLGQARGAVRCGSCLQIFQATDHLLTPPDAPPAAEHWHNALDEGAQAMDTAENDRLQDQDDHYDDDPEADPGNIGTSREEDGLDGSRFGDSFLSLDSDGHDDHGLGENFSDMGGAARTSHNNDTDEAWAEALLQDLANEEEPVSTPPRPAHGAEAPAPGRDDSHLDFLGATPGSGQVANERLDLTNDQNGGSHVGAWLQWGSLSVLMLLVLVGQYAFFHFDTLSRAPQWRPLYAQACQYLGCELPLRSDITTLRGANLIVRSAPDYRNALRVDALLYNDGQWPQPFPVLDLSFNNLSGNVVASRRFLPSEYLHGQSAGLDTMPVNTPIHVSLEIVDPGDQAVGYNLRLLPAHDAGPRVGQAP